MNQFGPQSTVRFETLGVDLATSYGTLVPSGGSINTKGSWVSLGTASFTYEALTVCLTKNMSASGGRPWIIDVGIDDGSGNINIIAQDLWFVLGPASNGGGKGCGIPLRLPLHVPSGSQLVARSQHTSASTNVSLTLIGHSTGLGGVPGYARLVPLTAFNLSNAVSCQSGIANTKARRVLVASTPYDAKALLLLMEPNTISTVFGYGWLVSLEVGASSVEEVVVQNYPLYNNVSHGGGSDVHNRRSDLIIPRNFAAGLRFTVHLQCSTANQTLRIALYAFQ